MHCADVPACTQTHASGLTSPGANLANGDNNNFEETKLPRNFFKIKNAQF